MLFQRLMLLLLLVSTILAPSISAAEESLYETLGISTSATTKDITRAYRKLALKYHPDKNTDGDKAEMEAVFTAIVNGKLFITIVSQMRKLAVAAFMKEGPVYPIVRAQIVQYNSETLCPIRRAGVICVKGELHTATLSSHHSL
jgi:hypothetical protein